MKMMTKMLLVGCEEDNHSVIDFYMNIVESVFKQKGYEVCYISYKQSGCFDKSIPVFVVTPVELVKWRVKGFKNIILWSQGVLPEESRLRNNSTLRYIVLSVIERFALRFCKISLLVSHYQCEYYEKKYHFKLKDKSFFMPCYNCELEEASFNTDDKYKNNVFCYVGSLAKWQCFEETVSFFKKIQKQLPDAVLKVLTPSVDKAKNILEKNGINNVVVKFVRQDELSKELQDCKYGFIIRDDMPINNVATPTKLSTYLSNGMIPIVSDCIKEFKSMLTCLHYKVLLDNNQTTEDVIALSKEYIDKSDVYNEYKQFFNRYFNTNKYIKELGEHIEKIMTL